MNFDAKIFSICVVSVSPAGLTVKRKDRFRENSKSVELVPQSTLASDVLGSVGSVETVDTVDTEDARLVSSDVVVVVPIPSRLFETGGKREREEGRKNEGTRGRVGRK